MACPPEPNYHGRQLVRELKRLRESATLNQDEVAERMHLTLQKVSRIENGQLPGYHELGALLELYGLPSTERDQYFALWDLAKARGWWRKYRVKDARCISMEHEAVGKYEFQLGHIPTLLQTEDYARAALSGGALGRSDSAMAGEVAVRMHQQERLVADRPLAFHCLLHEPVLYQGVDRAQILLLTERTALPNVTFQIVPQKIGWHAGLRGSFTVLTFGDPNEPDMACTEDLLGLNLTQDDERLADVRRTIAHLSELALSPEDSILTIEKMATMSR